MAVKINLFAKKKSSLQVLYNITTYLREVQLLKSQSKGHSKRGNSIVRSRLAEICGSRSGVGGAANMSDLFEL